MRCESRSDAVPQVIQWTSASHRRGCRRWKRLRKHVLTGSRPARSVEVSTPAAWERVSSQAAAAMPYDVAAAGCFGDLGWLVDWI